MNFPRYTNPHFLTHNTRLISRDDLSRDSDVDQLLAGGDKEELRAHLDQILSKRGLNLKRTRQTTDDATHGDTGRRKRSKVTQGEQSTSAAAEQITTFRLISHLLPPQHLELTPKPFAATRVREPAYEDSSEQSARRTHQAQSAAVDSAWIISEATKPVYIPLNFRNNMVELNVKLPLPSPPPIMVTEWSKSQGNKILPVDVHTCLPSPHTLPPKGLCCPIVSTEHETITVKKKRMRCPKSKRRRAR